MNDEKDNFEVESHLFGQDLSNILSFDEEYNGFR